MGVFVDEQYSLEDRRLGTLLAEQLRKVGLVVVPVPECDLVIAYSTRELTSRIDTTTPVSTPSTTLGNIGEFAYWQTHYSTTWVPTSYDYTVKGVWLRAYVMSDVRTGRANTVWEGYIGGDEAEFEKDPAGFVGTLVAYFGRDHKGRTRLTRSTSPNKPKQPIGAPSGADG